MRQHRIRSFEIGMLWHPARFGRQLLAAVIAVCPALHGQGLITTLAGNGIAGFAGDGGPAIAAQLHEPHHIAIDRLGNVYVADHWNHRVRRISPSGVISTVAGTGQAGFFGDGGLAVNAGLRQPEAVAVDDMGNVYISDCYNDRIRRIDTSGVITTIAGNGGSGDTSDTSDATSVPLHQPMGIALDSSGTLYFADHLGHSIWRLTPQGGLSRVAGGNGAGYSGDGGPALSAQLYYPVDVRPDGAGSLIIADDWNHCIRKVGPSGTISTIAGIGGGPGFDGDGGPAVAARMRYPFAVTTDGAGSIFVADNQNLRVRRIAPDGTIVTIAGDGTYGFGGDGGPATSAEMTWTTGVAIFGDRLYIADSSNNRIRVVVLDHGPLVSDVVASPNPASVGVSIRLQATLVDEDYSSVASTDYSIDGVWIGPVPLPQGPTAQLDTVLPPFGAPAVHRICVRGSDTAGIVGTAKCIDFPVYDAAGGFVTGGGTIVSPAGAYKANPAVAGSANFAFVAKYQKRSDLPSGETEFHLKADQFDFKSSSYAWLVVAGDRAEFRGQGTIKGRVGVVEFAITAIDGKLEGRGRPDTFRMKIWDAGGLIYDNETGTDDADKPTTAVSGGSIVIHK